MRETYLRSVTASGLPSLPRATTTISGWSPTLVFIASGLAMRSGVLEGTVIAFREINSWKFVNPVFIGDTINVEMEVTETKALPRIGGGAVNITLDVKKQSGETVMKGSWTVLVMTKP